MAIGVVVPYHTLLVEFSFVIHLIFAEMCVISVAITFEMFGEVTSALVGGVLNPWSLHGLTKNDFNRFSRSSPFLRSHPGAIKCPGGTSAHGFFSCRSLSLSSSLSSSSNFSLFIRLKNLFNSLRVLGPTLPNCSIPCFFWNLLTALDVKRPK